MKISQLNHLDFVYATHLIAFSTTFASSGFYPLLSPDRFEVVGVGNFHLLFLHCYFFLVFLKSLLSKL